MPPTCRSRRPARSRTSRRMCSPTTSSHHLAGDPLERRLRRSRELLHRDRLPEGAADRLQLRHRAASRPLPHRRRAALAAARVAPEPSREARVSVGLLAHAAARPRHPARRVATCRPAGKKKVTATMTDRRSRSRRRRVPHRRRAVEHASLQRRSRAQTAIPAADRTSLAGDRVHARDVT